MNTKAYARWYSDISIYVLWKQSIVTRGRTYQKAIHTNNLSIFCDLRSREYFGDDEILERTRIGNLACELEPLKKYVSLCLLLKVTWIYERRGLRIGRADMLKIKSDQIASTTA